MLIAGVLVCACANRVSVDSCEAALAAPGRSWGRINATFGSEAFPRGGEVVVHGWVSEDSDGQLFLSMFDEPTFSQCLRDRRLRGLSIAPATA